MLIFLFIQVKAERVELINVAKKKAAFRVVHAIIIVHVVSKIFEDFS